MKPIIGITPSYENGKYYLNQQYVKAVAEAGGLPFIIPFEMTDFDMLFSIIDGLVLSGGGDVHPKHYNEPLHPETRSISLERDTFDLSICNEAVRRNIPMLCICRGMQVLNVAHGGTLMQHIENHAQKEERHIRTHQVQVVKDSLLHTLTSLQTMGVNSFHHQNVKDLAPKLTPCAYNEEGMIEAASLEQNDFVLAVQWHPENLIDGAEHFVYFQELVERAKQFKKKWSV